MNEEFGEDMVLSALSFFSQYGCNLFDLLVSGEELLAFLCAFLLEYFLGMGNSGGSVVMMLLVSELEMERLHKEHSGDTYESHQNKGKGNLDLPTEENLVGIGRL